MHQGVNFSGDALGPRLFCPGANKNKDGRHVGLDFYDLLIEALRTPPMSDKKIYQQRSRKPYHPPRKHSAGAMIFATKDCYASGYDRAHLTVLHRQQR